jgi:hypothetical protein
MQIKRLAAPQKRLVKRDLKFNGRTDMTKLTGVFRHYAHAPKKAISA